MLIFKKIRWKNFLSTGDVWSEIELNTVKSSLIVGANGHGKSTILDALTFSLFGKPFRKINKPDLCNSVNNSDCVVEIDFEVYSKTYKIIRGLKPNRFEIYCNGLLLNQDAASKDYQNYLERHVLKMNIKSFTQIVILGSASFTPFMQLTPADRRIIIEDLLDIQIFSTMLVLAKQKLQQNKENIEKNKFELKSSKDKLEFLEKTLKGLYKNNEDKSDEIKNQINDYEDKIESIKNDISLLEKEKDDLIEQKNNIQNMTKMREKYQSFLSVKSKIEHNKKRFEKENTFFKNNDECSTCKQSIDDTFKNKIMTDNNKKIDEIDDGIILLDKQIDDLIQDINNVEAIMKKEHDVCHKIKSNKSTLNNYEEIIKSLNDSLTRFNQNDKLITDNKAEIKDTENAITNLENIRKNLNDDKSFLETSVLLLKDGGIKTKIIKQYIPIMNKYVNAYLNKMGFFVKFEIDENFDEKIKSRYLDEFSYNNFSEGEKTRIDLALLFTWRNISKMKNSINTNLLILDEILDGSLDANGTDEFLKIIKSLTDGTNTFIISHKQDQLLDKFDKTYKFEKIRNFSRIV